MRGPEAWLRENARYGDLLLTGGTDQISRVIQIATGGNYSHTMIVVDNNMVIEAHDRAEESSGGVFTTAFREMLERDGVSRVSLFRAPDLDTAALRDAIDEVESTSPSFDSAGIILLGAMRALGTAQRRLAQRTGLSESTPGRLAQRGVKLTGDGLHRVHCAELVTRLYMRAGLPLVFERPTFMHLLVGLDRCEDDSCTNPNHRSALLKADSQSNALAINQIADLKQASTLAHTNAANDRGGDSRRSNGHLSITGQRHPVARMIEFEGRLAQFVRTAVGRRHHEHTPDQADFVVPSDYATAEPFVAVGTLICIDGAWQLGHDEAAHHA